MSYNWSFHSFDYDRFESALIHSRRKIVGAVIDEMRQFNFGPDEIERYSRAGRRLIESGFSYAGWAASDFEIVDRFVFNLFHTCAEEINFEPESSAFLSPYLTSDFPSHLQKRFFWSRPEPIPAENREYVFLPFFTHNGRRLGEQLPSDCEYVALDLHETRLLRAEIERFLSSADGHALDARFDNSIRNDFLGPVTAAIRKGKALHAQVS